MILYKTDRIKKEFTSGEISSNLISILYMLSTYCNMEFRKSIIITDLLRSEKEQYHIYKNNKRFIKKPWMSVHQFGRGADVRSSCFDKNEIKKIKDFLNCITYDDKHKTAIYHSVGFGKHFHIQTKE